MRTWTGIEISEQRDKLERGVAMLLGFMLFEYTRLDMSLGLALAWAEGGRNLETRSEQFADATLHAKLIALQQTVQAKFANEPETRKAYEALIHDVHCVREFRNTLVHGRWGFEATEQVAVCVTGVPTSPKQRKNRYTIADLEKMLESLRSVDRRLRALVTHTWL